MIVILILGFLGGNFKFYQKFYCWDLLLHLISGICFTSIGYGIAKSITGLNAKHRIIFGFMFAIVIHVFWELFEFTGDQFLNLNMQRWSFDPNMPDTFGPIISLRTPGVVDTMTDFIANICGAVIMSISYFILSKHHSKDT